MNPYSEKCKNGIRVALIIIEVVRERLDLTLNELIKQQNFKDLNDFLVRKSKKSKFYPAQMKMLYPNNQLNPTNSSEEFDCTLCLTLLNDLNLITDVKENIDRLRIIRNENFGHIASMELENNELRRLSEFKTDIFDNVYNKYAYENNYSIVARIEFSIYGLCSTNNEKVNFEKKISNYLTMRIEDINVEQFMDIKRQLEELMNINNEMVRNELSDMGTKIERDFRTVHRSLEDIRDTCGKFRNSITEQKNQLQNFEERMDLTNREQLKELKNFKEKFDEHFKRVEPKIKSIVKNEHEYVKKRLDGFSQNMDDMPIRITETLAKKEEEMLHRIFLKFDDKTKCIEEQVQVSLKKLESIIPKKKTRDEEDYYEEYCMKRDKDMFDRLKDVLSDLIDDRMRRSEESYGSSEGLSWIIDHQKVLKSLEEDILKKLDQLSKERINDSKNIQSKLNAIEINLGNIFSYILENIKNESSQERYLIDYENIIAKLDFSTDLIIQSVESIYFDNQEIKELINSSKNKKHDECEGGVDYERYEDNRDLLKRIFEILKKIDLSQYEHLMKQFSDINERTSNLFSLASLKLRDDDLEKIYKLIKEQMDKLIVDLNERLEKDFLEVKLRKENEKLKRERKIMPLNQYMQLDINCNDKNELKIECYDNDKNPIKFSSLYFNKKEYRIITREFDEGEFSDEKDRFIEKIPFNFSLSLTPDLKVSCIYFEGMPSDNKPKISENFASEEMPWEDFVNRLERENAKSGQVSVSLMWNNENDLDLHVIDPNNEEIYYRNKKSASGGELDVDMNADPEKRTKTPVENIVWPWNMAPKGKYKVFVNYFAKHCNQDQTNYKISVYSDNKRNEFSGCIKKEDGKKFVHEFECKCIDNGIQRNFREQNQIQKEYEYL